jgi:transketolase
LGATHHCPGDVGIMLSIPGAEIYVPGTPKEFSNQFNKACRNEKISYFRLSEKTNNVNIKIEFQKGSLVKKGELLTVLAIGPMLDMVLEATSNLDVTVLYYNSISPFDAELLRSNIESRKLYIAEPFYENTIAPIIQQNLSDRTILTRSKGIPRRFITNYGKTDEHYEAFGMTSRSIRSDIQEMLNA